MRLSNERGCTDSFMGNGGSSLLLSGLNHWSPALKTEPGDWLTELREMIKQLYEDVSHILHRLESVTY